MPRPRIDHPSPSAERMRRKREREAAGLVQVTVEVPAGTEQRIERAAEELRRHPGREGLPAGAATTAAASEAPG